MTAWPTEVPLIQEKARPPVGIILGSPAEAAQLAGALETDEVVCFQMDLHQAERLRQEIARRSGKARVVAAPDLWDSGSDYQSLIYPAAEGGERQLKLDMVEQAFHALRPRGTLLVISRCNKDDLFPAVLKKIFGRCHAPEAGARQVFWARRQGDRPRRRHQLTFQVRMPDGKSLRFLTRPGVFSFGRFDHGARALVETMSIASGERVVDMGCGCGTNGVWAGRLAGPDGSVTFVDSNVRALALAEYNARSNGLARWQTVASSEVANLSGGTFDVALANPPYYAQQTIAHNFVEQCHALLRPGGRLYLVTKQANQIGPFIAGLFGQTEVISRRGYQVVCARQDADGGRKSP
jgi:16S rRNA (guanine1207-N2)-methyltransferase